MISRSGSLETIPRGAQPLTSPAGVCRWGLSRLRAISEGEPGKIGRAPGSRLKTAPPERSWSAAARPRASYMPSNVSPAEWATMNHGGRPAARSDPIIDPAEVPTM